MLIFETLHSRKISREGETKTQIFGNRHVEFRKSMREFLKINVRKTSCDGASPFSPEETKSHFFHVGHVQDKTGLPLNEPVMQVTKKGDRIPERLLASSSCSTQSGPQRRVPRNCDPSQLENLRRRPVPFSTVNLTPRRRAALVIRQLDATPQ
jgi:hypothetical protein